MKCIVTLKELYGIDTVLAASIAIRIDNRVPKSFRLELMNNIDITYGSHHRYYADLDEVYNYFKSKYPDEIKRRRIFDYNGLLSEAYKYMIY